MNRKLHNTILAFWVTGMVLFLGMVVAQPAVAPTQASSPAPVVVATVAHARHDGLADAAIAASLEARARKFEQEVAGATDAGEAFALTIGFIAATATEAALASALTGLETAVNDREKDGSIEARDSRRATARGSSGSRDLIAVPYFSFARGSRGASRS